MNWRQCESLKTLLNQLNVMFPSRSKESDGSIGDLRHQHEKSDHNPNAAGVVTAEDITHDPRSGCTGTWLSQALIKSGDPRIKYIIWDGKITVKGDITKWKPYEGASPHREHVHLSVASDPKLYDDPKQWDLSKVAVPPPGPGYPTIQQGNIGMAVKALQKALGIKIDGVFGLNTDKAVRSFQATHGLREDGIVGTNTWKALGL